MKVKFWKLMNEAGEADGGGGTVLDATADKVVADVKPDATPTPDAKPDTKVDAKPDAKL